MNNRLENEFAIIPCLNDDERLFFFGWNVKNHYSHTPATVCNVNDFESKRMKENKRNECEWKGGKQNGRTALNSMGWNVKIEARRVCTICEHCLLICYSAKRKWHKCIYPLVKMLTQHFLFVFHSLKVLGNERIQYFCIAFHEFLFFCHSKLLT